MDQNNLEFVCKLLLGGYSTESHSLAWDIKQASEGHSESYVRSILEDASEKYGVSLETLIVLAGITRD